MTAQPILGSLLPNGMQQFADGYGKPLKGGTVAFFEPGTSTPKPTWGDPAETILNPNPVVLDDNGRAIIYGTGQYRQLVKDRCGNIIWDQLTFGDDGGTSFGPIFTNIASLRANTRTGLISVWLEGYYNIADEGGGAFNYVPTDTTSADNGGTIIVDLAGQRWYRDVGTLCSVKWFGAKGSNNDDTAAIQSAFTACQGKYTAWFPDDSFRVTGTLNVTAGLAIAASPWTANITWVSTTLNVLNVNTTAAVSITGLTFTGPANATAGAVITITAPSGSNSQSVFRDLHFLNGWIQMAFVNAAYWKMEQCDFNQWISAGVSINNLSAPDTGDMEISGCLILGKLGNAGSGILYQSSGGLKITNTKFLTGAVGLNVSMANVAGNTGDLLVSNCSFEGWTTCGMQFARPAGTLSFAHICITGNQFGLCAAGISFATPAAGADWANVAITGNQIGVNAANSCINLSSVTNFTVGNNTMLANAGGASGIGIQVGASSSNGKIGTNAYTGLATTLSNNSTTTTAATDEQTGTSSATMAANGYGALFFSAAVVISFPIPYTVAPTPADINVVITALTGGLGVGYVVLPGSLTKTQFSVQIIGAANSGAVPFRWSSRGII